ncbi:TPA: hypothetical protein DF272_01580 [Candidatus Falkowbacteria bacterium]|nr:hypothetical protein [Candidatus Falkowbacteria bacterium]
MKYFSLNYDDAQTSESKLAKTAKKLTSYVEQCRDLSALDDYSHPEQSLYLPFDEKMIAEVESVVSQYNLDQLKYIVLIGIGGSNLGTKAVYDALVGPMDQLLPARRPKMIFLDTVDSQSLYQTAELLNSLESKTEFLLVAVSKSGTTTETVANFASLRSLIDDTFPEINSRCIVITDENSALWQKADRLNMAKIAIPKLVGGRYSVFSPVGLLPLALAGLNARALLRGAAAAVKAGTKVELTANKSLLSAVITFLQQQKLPIHNTFLFNPRLESCGRWYRQLMGESLGKKNDARGKKVHAGITPIVSIGSTDLHSMAQLYYGGPKDKFTNIVYCLREDSPIVPASDLAELAPNTRNKSLVDIMRSIIGGVKAGYRKNKLPFISIVLPSIDEGQLGYYLQFRLLEMMYLAKLMNLNAFDQPSVEDYKHEMSKLLAKS